MLGPPVGAVDRAVRLGKMVRCAVRCENDGDNHAKAVSARQHETGEGRHWCCPRGIRTKDLFIAVLVVVGALPSAKVALLGSTACGLALI